MPNNSLDRTQATLHFVYDQYMRCIWVVMLFTATLSACANVSRFESGALVAHGEHLNGASEILYYSIFIESGGRADVHMKDIYLKLTPDATPLLLSELRPGSVSRYLPRFNPPPQWPENLKEKAMETEAYSGGGFHITFNNGRLLSVGICSHCSEGREHPIIGTPDGNRFYSLPLTEQQLKDVFGMPDRVYKVNEVRY
jgi:hypothetical protein